MKVPEETEKRLLILYAVQSLKNRATKEDVLNYLRKQDIVLLNKHDVEYLSTRTEERWRNDFAYVRSHLVRDGYLSNAERGYWIITEEGKTYYQTEIRKLDRNSLFRIKKYDLLFI